MWFWYCLTVFQCKIITFAEIIKIFHFMLSVRSLVSGEKETHQFSQICFLNIEIVWNLQFWRIVKIKTERKYTFAKPDC